MKRYNMPKQRYNLLDGESYSERYQMVEEKNGDWVWWEDVEAQFAELETKCAGLLEALEKALDALGGNDPHDLGYDDSICGYIRAAIAKAKGEVMP